MRIICLFNLKEGVNVAEYEDWAKTRDLPAVKGLGSVSNFSVHKAVGVFGDDNAKPHFDYIEIIDVKGMDDFVAEISTDEFQAAAAPFLGFAEAPQFILTEDL